MVLIVERAADHPVLVEALQAVLAEGVSAGKRHGLLRVMVESVVADLAVKNSLH